MPRVRVNDQGLELLGWALLVSLASDLSSTSAAVRRAAQLELQESPLVRQLLEAVGETPEALLRARGARSRLRKASRNKREIMVGKGGMRGA
jgi:hypothetical protein